MAPRRKRDRVSEGAPRGREKHGWLRFDRYQQIHESALERHPFVVEDRTSFSRLQLGGSVAYRIEGTVVCRGGIEIAVTKLLETRVARGREEVRGVLYRYHAHIQGRANILRYDNSHAPEEFRRHEYDLQTGEMSGRAILEREQMPTLIEVVDELEQLARDLGLLA